MVIIGGMRHLVIKCLLIDLTYVELLELLLFWVINDLDDCFIVRGRQIIIKFTSHRRHTFSHSFSLLARTRRLLVQNIFQVLECLIIGVFNHRSNLSGLHPRLWWRLPKLFNLVLGLFHLVIAQLLADFNGLLLLRKQVEFERLILELCEVGLRLMGRLLMVDKL